MMCFSHPNKLLSEHLENTRKLGLGVFDNKKNLHFTIPKEKIRKSLEIALYCHDFGKATSYFQDYLKEGQKCAHPEELTRHALLSACIAGYLIKKETDNDILSKIGFIAVRKHHGDLKDLDYVLEKKHHVLKNQFETIDFSCFKENIQCDFDEVWDFVYEELQDIDFDNNLETYILLNFFFSILTYSDKSDVVPIKQKYVAFDRNIVEFVDRFKSVKFNEFSELDNMRNEIYLKSLQQMQKIYHKGNIFHLNVPTGSGKTLTALNLAFNMLTKDDSLQRVIYALPYTSILDQTEEVIKDMFNTNNESADKYTIVHHHLADLKIENNENYISGGDAQFLIENWDKPIILTTFWQLFYTLISNKNAQIRKFHNIANSVIILDEVQSIPYKYWMLVKELFTDILRILNCKIIFLTATMPLIFEESNDEILPLIDSQARQNYFQKFSRYSINIIKNETLDLNGLFETAKNDIEHNNNKNFLFVFNTINSSIKFYTMLKSQFYDKDLIYLSTNILPIERKKRIQQIKDNSKNKIIVSTQLIEAGVDIDVDIIYRDFAPFDSIIQTAGRCNRHNKRQSGKVVIFKLINEKGEYDYHYIYNSLTSIETDKLFTDKTYQESQLLDLTDKYYQLLKENSSQQESRKLIENMKSLKYEELNEFQLIEEIPSYNMFLAMDETATQLLDKFLTIIKIEDRYERKSEFLKIKSLFYQYVLSFRATSEYAFAFEEIGNLKLVRQKMVDSIYDFETGLKREWSIFI